MQENSNEKQENDKRYIEFSLGKVIIAIIVIALIIGDIWLGIYAYNLRNNKEDDITNNSTENTIDT